MTMKHAAAAAALAAAAVLALASGGAVAKGPGGGPSHGMHAFHFKSHMLAHRHHRRFAHRHNHNNNALAWPYYGYYDMPYGGEDTGDAASGDDASPAVVFVRDYPPRLNCDKVRETITVPSESGGTRDITVTRC